MKGVFYNRRKGKERKGKEEFENIIDPSEYLLYY